MRFSTSGSFTFGVLTVWLYLIVNSAAVFHVIRIFSLLKGRAGLNFTAVRGTHPLKLCCLSIFLPKLQIYVPVQAEPLAIHSKHV